DEKTAHGPHCFRWAARHSLQMARALREAIQKATLTPLFPGLLTGGELVRLAETWRLEGLELRRQSEREEATEVERRAFFNGFVNCGNYRSDLNAAIHAHALPGVLLKPFKKKAKSPCGTWS
ncbi:MAG: hypothetical protein JXK94_13180, partial [Deltaproteobacteria bacterium]|nr:hypothetical protein [Deltaproteobacteria bacterium]